MAGDGEHTNMTNEELLNMIREGRQDNSILMELWNQNKGMIQKACKKYKGMIDAEDAEQECFLCFLDAVKQFEPQGQKFAGFLYDRCRWHLHRYYDDCGTMVRVPVYQRQIIDRYRRFVHEWYQEHGELPDDRTICIMLQIKPDQLDQLRKDLQTVDMRSIDEPLPGEADGLTIADTVQDNSVDVEAGCVDGLLDQERRLAVWAAVDSLPPKEGQAVQLYYRDGLTYQQAGEVMGISRDTVRQCIAKGMRQLRTHKKYRALRDFTDLSPVYAMGIRGGAASFNRTWTSSTEAAALWSIEHYARPIRSVN